MSYEHSDDSGAIVHISDQGDCAHISLGATTCCLISNERQAAAQELAGDEYRVVPANVPHGCQWTDDPDDPCPVCGQKLPEWERELLAREAQAAQPDRPEPVDPASVKVGQVVEIEADDGSWMVRARVADTDDPSHDGPPYPEGSPFGIKLDRFYWWPKLADATVRILQRPEPEVDEAAVEALARALYAAKAERIGLNRDWTEIGKEDQLRHRTEALTLIRDHGVEVPSDA